MDPSPRDMYERGEKHLFGPLPAAPDVPAGIAETEENGDGRPTYIQRVLRGDFDVGDDYDDTIEAPPVRMRRL